MPNSLFAPEFLFMSETRRPVVYPLGKGTWLSFHDIPSRVLARGEETNEAQCVPVGTTVTGGGGASSFSLSGGRIFLRSLGRSHNLQ